MSNRLRFALAVVAALWLTPQPASAAKVLFVSDTRTDLSIETVLRRDGHDLTIVENDFSSGNNPSFHGDLSLYDCIVWSASNDGAMSAHTDMVALANLVGFVSSGGNVFVTGYGSVGFNDEALIAFLGGETGTGFTGAPLAVANLDTDLTTGVVDIRGVTPSSHGELSWEALDGLGTDTVAIVLSSTDATGAQWAIRTVGEGHIAWVAALEGVDDEWTNTAMGSGGAFNAALRNFVTASTGSASVPGAPLVTFDAPFSANEGDPITITAHIMDPEGDSTTFSWDLDHDGTYGEQPGEPTVMIAAGVTDGPDNFLVSVEASDGTHVTHRSHGITINNVPPHITSHPPMSVGIDQHVLYALTIVDPGGAHDPPTFTMPMGPSAASITAAGVFDWTTSESDIAAASQVVSLVVDDGDGGTDTQTWSISVINDHAPSDPMLLYPTMDEPLLIAGIHMAIASSSDLDGDTITYTFEIASDAAFDADLQTSPTVADSATGITEWRPDETMLRDGRWYWRVTASDGHVSTSPVTSTFQLVPDPTTFPDVGVADAGPDAGMASSASRGCSCGVAARDRGFGPLAAISALITLMVLRTRRRR